MRYLEHVGVVGRGCGDLRRPGDGDRRRRVCFTGAGDLEKKGERVSDTGR